MTLHNVDQPTVKAWRLAGERLLELGAIVAPKSEEGFGGLAESAEMEAFDATLEEYEGAVDAVLAGDGPASSLSLVGSLAVAEELLALTDEEGVDGLAVDRGESARAVLAQYERAMLGAADDVELPKEFGEKLDALQDAGADEVVALGTSEVVVGAVVGAVTGIAQIGGPVVKQAFDAVAQLVNVFRAKVIGLLKWTVERLRRWLPESFQEAFDDKLDDVKEWMQGKLGDQLSRVLGQVLGRGACEEAWTKAKLAGRDLDPAVALLDDTVAGELNVIEKVGAARKAVDGVAAKLLAWVGAAVPAVRVVVGVAAIAVVAVVLYQVDEGFDQIGALVAEPA